VVADDRGVADGRPGPAGNRQQRDARLTPEDDGGPTTAGVAADPKPVLGQPAGDGLLVALDRAAGGALQAVVQPAAQQLPDVAAMVADPGQPLDHGGDAGQGPVVGVEAVRAGTLAQDLVDGGQLGIRQARRLPGGAALPSAFRPPPRQRACQRLTFWRAPPR
jgi:hypothetical protein